MNKKLILLPVLFISLFYFAFADSYPRNYSIHVKHYAFYLQLSDSTDEIIGTALLDVRCNKSGTHSILLDLINKSLERKDKGMLVTAVTVDGKSSNYTHQHDALIIDLPIKRNGQNWNITIHYRGIPAGGLKIGPTKFGDRSFFNENWPNNARHWLPTIDHVYDKATSEFIITAPSKYKVVSNGLLQNETLLNNGYKITHWKQSVPVAPWLFVLGVAQFEVQDLPAFSGKPIQTWVYPQNKTEGFFDFKEPTKKVLQFYSDYIGPFAYEKLANIQSPSVSGGMETSSAIFYAEQLISGTASVRLRDVIIHEIAHQWFGNAVTEKTWDDAWLSEGFATYFTLLFQEKEYGHDYYIEGLKKAKKSIAAYLLKDSTFSIIQDRTAELEPVTSTITYQKGAWVLHMLRAYIGEENFKKGIRAYYKKYFNSNANTADFIKEMEIASSKKLKSFLKQWLYTPYTLTVNGGWTFDENKKALTIHLSQDTKSSFLFDVPVAFAIHTTEKKDPLLITVPLNTQNKSIQIPCKQKPTSIDIDPETILLANYNFKQF